VRRTGDVDSGKGDEPMYAILPATPVNSRRSE
jgi:hypothetical protein